jgi:hypothetical protein
VMGRMEVLSRVPILRVVAATDMPAGPAESQMDPSIAELEALLATVTTRLIGPHEIEMTALLSHETRTDDPGWYNDKGSSAGLLVQRSRVGAVTLYDLREG